MSFLELSILTGVPLKLSEKIEQPALRGRAVVEAHFWFWLKWVYKFEVGGQVPVYLFINREIFSFLGFVWGIASL